MEQQTSIDDRGRRSESLSKTIKKAVNRETPSSLDTPQLLMNQPHTVSNKNQNNALMKDDKPYNKDKAHEEWKGLYSALVKAGATIHLLPSTYKLQDLTFVANLGIYLPHLKPDTVIVSNFKSPPRKGEDHIGIKFFDSLGYAVHQPKTTWEGEADLKWVRDNIFIGGYGIRTDPKTYDWMMDKFEMEIIPVKMSDEKLYHFDCQFFPLSLKQALASPSAFRPQDLKKVEKYVDLIEVPKEFIYDGWTNSVKIGKKVFCADIPDAKSTKTHGDLLRKAGYEPVDIDLDEFAKSGGDLSCMVMTLTYGKSK